MSPIVKKTKTAPRKRVVKKRKKTALLLEASALGIASEQLATVQSITTPLVSPAIVPPFNLPVGARTSIRMRDPLVAPRTSFWLGVGFGMLIVGALTAIAWQLFRVETVEAIVVSLTRP